MKQNSTNDESLEEFNNVSTVHIRWFECSLIKKNPYFDYIFKSIESKFNSVPWTPGPAQMVS